VTDAAIQRAMGRATTVLGELGVGTGDRVLWTSMLSEAAHFWPFVVGTMLAGAQLSCADATSAEATRVAMFCGQIDYRAVMGVTGAILDGLDELGRAYADVFGDVAVLGARPDAYARLAAVGLRPHHVALVGPAFAVALEPGGPAFDDADEWQLDLIDGHVAVSSTHDGGTRFTRAATAAHATKVDRGAAWLTT
jgi:hypothetical protein